MKKFLKFALLFTFALATENQIWHNLSFSFVPLTIIKVAIILAIFELLLKPIIRFILIPINILTLGLIRSVIDTLGLYLATFILSDFKINNIFMASSSWQGFQIPKFEFNGIFAFFVSSITISFLIYIYNLILVKKEIKK
ncbi:MAG: phage holin family protein [Candidatus Shapirobacteria bacterium]